MSEPLSPTGWARREALLGELLGSMERVHHRRRQRRRVVAAALLVTIGGVVAMLGPTASVEVARPMASAVPGTPAVSEPRIPWARWRLAVVKTDPTVLDRYEVAPKTRAMVVDDDSLLGALAAIDRPTGLVRQGDRLWLTSDVLTPR